MSLVLPSTFVFDKFNKYVPQDFLRDITRQILHSYQQCASHSSISQELYEKRYRTNTRNGAIDTQLQNTARKYFNIKGIMRENCTKTHLYTELIISNQVILTASSVNSLYQLPPRVIFRLEAAKNNPGINQLDLLHSNIISADFVNKTYRDENPIYGIILHGPAKKAFPEFIIIAIPDHNYKFQLAHINLLERYLFSSAKHDDQNNTQNGTQSFNMVDIPVEEIEKPSAQLRIRSEKYIEDDDKVSGEIDEAFGNDTGDEGA